MLFGQKSKGIFISSSSEQFLKKFSSCSCSKKMHWGQGWRFFLTVCSKGGVVNTAVAVAIAIALIVKSSD